MTALAAASALRTHFGAGARFIGSFGTAKATALAGPLLLARLLAPAEYGAVELALSIGLLIGVVGSLGLPLAVPQLYLTLARRRVEDLLAFQVLTVIGVSALAGVALWRLQLSASLVLGTVLAGLFSAQSALSAYCRVRQLRTVSAWVDNLCLILVPALALGDLAAGHRSMSTLSGSCVAAALLVGAAAFVVLRRHWRPGFGAAYRDAVGRGSAMMVNALLVFGVTSSLRLFIGFYLPLDDVAVYSLCARICLALVMVHQLAATGLFAQIYGLAPERCDRWFSLCLGGLVVFGVVLTAGANLFATHWRWGALDMSALRIVFPIVCAQTVLWIVSAWLDMLVNREGLAGWSAGMLAVLLAGFTGCVAGLDALGALRLSTVNLLFAGFLFAAVMGQVRLLAHRGLRLPRLQRVLLAVPALTLAALL